jgi:hypothetical protein
MKKWDIIVNTALGAIVATMILGAGGFLFKSVWDYSNRIGILEVNQNATNRALVSEISHLEEKVNELVSEIKDLKKIRMREPIPDPIDLEPEPPAPEPTPPEPTPPEPDLQEQGTDQNQDVHILPEDRIRGKLKSYRQDQVQMQQE